VSEPVLQEVQLNSIISKSKVVEYPFKHMLIDNFLPNSFLKRLIEDVRSLELTSPDNSFESAFGTKREWRDFPASLFHLSSWTRYLASPSFISALGKVFGLASPDRLTPDTTYDGGGYVISPPGAYLSYHADFNFSSKARKYRVINVLFYFNEDYSESFGGLLHLLDHESKTVEITVAPRMNTLLAFLTDDVSFHGVSRNAATFSRRSFNIYYYADLPLSHHQSEKPHKTIWVKPIEHAH
jgi:hypothetical protein